MNQQKTKYKTTICRHFAQKGYCSLSDKCHFAHGFHQLRRKTDPTPSIIPPTIEPISIYKTTLCKYFMNGFCRSAHLCPFAHGLNDVHQVVIKNYQTPSQTQYGNAGQFLCSILKGLQVVFSQNQQKKQLIKKGMEMVQQKDLLKADQIITQIVKSSTLTTNQKSQCQTILQNAYALHKIKYSPY